MRKLIVLSTAIFISGAIFAANSPFSPGPTPTQDYHSASDSNDLSASPLIAPPVAPQVVSPIAAPAPTPILSTNGAAVINAAGVNTGVAGQVSMLSQASMAFEQETDQHIQNLVDSNQAMAAALQTTNQEVIKLQVAVAQLESGHAITSPAKGFLRGLNRNDLTVFIEFGGAAAFLLFLGVMMGRLIRRSPVVVVPSESRNKDVLVDDTKNEYDFMNSAEAIPAKLDLARSYVMMNDFDQARMILKGVMEKGTDEHVREAESILSKIKNIAGN